MSELHKRIAVAAVGIPLVLLLVYLGGWYLAVPLAGFAAWGTHEVARLAGVKGVRPLEAISSTAAAGFVLLASWHGTFKAFAPWAVALIGATLASSLVGALWRRGPNADPLTASAVTFASAVYLGLSFACAPLLHALPAARDWTEEPGFAGAGLLVVALPLATTWIGDAAAFFAGSAWGGAKLAPTISPNKSWVGFWASLVGGSAAAVVWLSAADRWLPGAGFGGWSLLAALGALLGLAAVVGDLVESLLKREAGVKDSGTFFPGHGGVLDRVDSLLFTIPVAYAALTVLGGRS